MRKFKDHQVKSAEWMHLEVRDSYDPGTVFLRVVLTEPAAKYNHRREFESKIDIFALADLVEQARPILDKHIDRLKALRGRLG